MDPTLKQNILKIRNVRKAISKIKIMNSLLNSKIQDFQKITDVHTLIYYAAIAMAAGRKQNKIAIARKPQWESRLERKINILMKKIGYLTKYTKNQNHSQRLE